MKKLTAILIGAGNRGKNYVKKMMELQERFQVVAVAEALDGRRKDMQDFLGLPDEACYSDWKEILSNPKMADIAMICTLDDMHTEPALAAIEKGYDLLLEKPVAQTPEECAKIALAAERKGVKVLVCHVLRYAPFYKKVKEIIMSGIIGDVLCINQTEGIGNLHFAHSYVRGNWHDAEKTTPMLLAKSCHDIDIIQWLVDKPCKKVQSFGSLTHFVEKNAPKDAPIRCSDRTCPHLKECPYDCYKEYLSPTSRVARRTACSKGFTKERVPTDEEVLEALKHTDYGLCVYHANNTTCDLQTVNFEFEGGITATLTVNAFNKGGRHIRIFGTKGELVAYMADTEIQVYTFEDKKTQLFPVQKTNEMIEGGHGGGDRGMICELYDYMNENYTGYCAADIGISVKNHLIGFAAEESRKNSTVADIGEYFGRYGLENN